MGDATPSGPPDYHAIYSAPFPGQGNNGGTAILVRRDVSFTILNLNTPLQAIAVQVFLRREYALCNLYLPPSIPVERRDLDHLVHALPSPFLLVGDMNGRHPLWGDCLTNARGVLLSSIV